MPRLTPEQRAFRERALTTLCAISHQLDTWYDDWTESEVPIDTLSASEYPFTQSLDELCSQVNAAVERLEDACSECGGHVEEHDYQCSQRQPAHREEMPARTDVNLRPPTHARPSFSLIQFQSDAGKSLTIGLKIDDATRTALRNATLYTPEGIARVAFRHMVAEFTGGYHPDTDDYVEYPEGYNLDRVREVEEFARACGIDLYHEALDVTHEALS